MVAIEDEKGELHGGWTLCQPCRQGREEGLSTPALCCERIYLQYIHTELSSPQIEAREKHRMDIARGFYVAIHGLLSGSNRQYTGCHAS